MRAHIKAEANKHTWTYLYIYRYVYMHTSTYTRIWMCALVMGMPRTPLKCVLPIVVAVRCVAEWLRLCACHIHTHILILTHILSFLLTASTARHIVSILAQPTHHAVSSAPHRTQSPASVNNNEMCGGQRHLVSDFATKPVSQSLNCRSMEQLERFRYAYMYVYDGAGS